MDVHLKLNRKTWGGKDILGCVGNAITKHYNTETVRKLFLIIIMVFSWVFQFSYKIKIVTG